MLKNLICWLIRDVFNVIFISIDKFSNEGKILCYIKNQEDATLAVLFISNCKITLHLTFC